MLTRFIYASKGTDSHGKCHARLAQKLQSLNEKGVVMQGNQFIKLCLMLCFFVLSQASIALGQTEDSMTGAPKGYVYDEQGRIVSGTEPKKTRIYIGIDKSKSMRSYTQFISDGARSLVQGLSERACADWEVVVYEIGKYSRGYEYASTTRPQIIKSTTPQGLDWIRHGVISDSAIQTGQEAPLNSLLSIISSHKGTFEDVDFVASIIVTDTLIFHEPHSGVDVASKIKGIIGKPFKSWSFGVFPENISEQCSADIYGVNDEKFGADLSEFMVDCLMAQYNNKYSRSQILGAINNNYGEILESPEGRYCDTRMVQHMGGRLDQYFGQSTGIKTFQELVNFNRETGGVSAPICEVDIAFSFNAITSSILEELGCKMLYLM